MSLFTHLDKYFYFVSCQFGSISIITPCCFNMFPLTNFSWTGPWASVPGWGEGDLPGILVAELAYPAPSGPGWVKADVGYISMTKQTHA